MNREELYAEVWGQPLAKVVQEYGLPQTPDSVASAVILDKERIW